MQHNNIKEYNKRETIRRGEGGVYDAYLLYLKLF